MNFPIPVNMTVDSGEAIQMTVRGDVTVSCVVDLRISPNVHETYDGPYSVTPSESVQTLETAEKAMADDVTVGAIPADYIGSSVPRKTSADLTASGPTVTAPAGYYAEAASKDVQRGSVRVNNTGITANPSISAGSDGKIRSTVSKVQSVSPYVTAGYVITGTAGNISVSGHSEMQLNTEAGKTVTPTESEQTAVAANKFTTGEVKVAAIPSDYIGSNVPQKSSSDLTVFGPTVTAPAGYYAEAATKSVAVGSVRVYDTAIPVTPSISIDSSGKITASVSKVQSVSPSVNAGYVTTGYAGNMNVSGSAELQMSTQAAQTITPTTADQTIASGTYLTGAQTIKGDANLLAENIKKDVTIFGVAGSLTSVQPMKFGVIRPDAELLQSYTYDKLLVTDNVGTWPAYSTTNKTLLSSANLSPTITMSYEDYHYYVLERMYVYPIYNTNSVGAGREEYHFSSLCYEIAQVQENTFNAMNGTPYGTRVFTISGEPVGRLIYWTSSSAMAGYNGTAQGLMINPVAPTASSGVLTTKSPSVTVKGGATYLSSTYFGAVTDCRIQYIIEVYRVSNESDLIGWGNTQQLLRMASCINSSSHTLT